jgi:hypothetical protein
VLLSSILEEMIYVAVNNGVAAHALAKRNTMRASLRLELNFARVASQWLWPGLADCRTRAGREIGDI